jgi:hypothetical protein
MFRTMRGGLMHAPPCVSMFTRAFKELPVVDVSALRRPDASLVRRADLPSCSLSGAMRD